MLCYIMLHYVWGSTLEVSQYVLCVLRITMCVYGWVRVVTVCVFGRSLYAYVC